MPNKKLVLLLTLITLIVFSIAYFMIKSNIARQKQELTSMNLLELIRTGYDLKNDNCAFPIICQLLNDTLLKEKSSTLRLQTITEIYVTDKYIDWGIEYDDYEPVPISDRLVFLVDISKDSDLKIQNTSSSISNLKSLARDYIFYPDSSARKITHRTILVEGRGEIEKTFVAAVINLHIPDKNGYSVSDWYFFFDCLHELVELSEEERNKTSLEVFNKKYTSLSFEEKDKITEFTGYKIVIEIIREPCFNRKSRINQTVTPYN